MPIYAHMKDTTIAVRNLFTGKELLENALIRIENQRIIEISKHHGRFDFENLAPGFIDLHINGGYDHYYTNSLSEEALADIEFASKETGCYYCLPALITSPMESIRKGLITARTYLDRNPTSGILGIHLEGPYLQPKKKGAHPQAYLRTPIKEELQEICHLGKDIIKIWTLAPEIFPEDLLQMLITSGINLSVGHSNATFDQTNALFDHGVKLTTHLYNAMSGLDHRNPGVAAAALLRKGIYNPIILDDKHVRLPMANLAYLSNPNSIILITDALFLGRKKKNFEWESFNATLSDGVYVNREGTLAGSAISLPEAIRCAVSELSIPLIEVISMVTSRPADAIGMQAQIGNIDVGYRSVFTTFEDDLQHFTTLD